MMHSRDSKFLPPILACAAVGPQALFNASAGLMASNNRQISISSIAKVWIYTSIVVPN